MNPMKLLFTRFPLESAYGGAEVQTLTLMQRLIDRGHSVGFAGSCPVLLEECRRKGIPAVEWHIGPPPVTKWDAIAFTWKQAGMKKKLAALLDQFHDLDAIAMLSLTEKLLLTDIAAATGVKAVWIEHDTVGPWLTRNPWLGLLLDQAARATTVVVSELSRTIYRNIGWPEERIVAIPNGVTGDVTQKTQDAPHEGLHLLCVARLSPEKGVDVLLRAIEHDPGVTLDIVGEGKERAALEALANEQDVKGRVRFLGRRNDVGTMYASYDALVLPSREHDPFGLVAAEAMMAGVPVVVTDACGIAGYLTNGKDALVARADNAESLARAIGVLGDAGARARIGKDGHGTATTLFASERMGDAYESVFRARNS